MLRHDPATAFLHELTGKHDLSDAVFLVNGYGYLTTLVRLWLGGQLNHVERNRIEKCLTLSRCRLTVSINRGWAIGSASEAYLSSSYTTILPDVISSPPDLRMDVI